MTRRITMAAIQMDGMKRIALALLLFLTLACNQSTTSTPTESHSSHLPTTSIPKGSFPPGNYANRPTAETLSSNAIEGVLVSARWRELEPTEGVYRWEHLDERIAAVASAEKVVVLNVMTAGINVPDWLLRKPGIETFSFEGTNPNQPIYGEHFIIPLYWDETYLKAQGEFIKALGARYAENTAVVGVMVSFLGTVNNDWYIPHSATETLLREGYTTERMTAIGIATLDRWANAFPTQALKLPLGRSIPDGENTITTLANRITDYAYAHYPNRFYAQVNALCTALPSAGSEELSQIGPDSLFYLLHLLAQHPHHIGFQLLCDASEDAPRLDKGNLCPEHTPYCTLEQTLEIALTYHPYYIEYWYQDINDPNLYPLLIEAATALQADNP